MMFLINQDIALSDTTLTDSIKRYAVPQIVEFNGFPTQGLDRTLLTVRVDDFPRRLLDAFFSHAFMCYDLGLGQTNRISSQGQDSRYTTFFLNGHRLTNSVSGYTNLTKFPSQFFEQITVQENLGGFGLTSVNLISKVNRYDLPYSYVRYGFGSFDTDMYDMDFTRALSNAFGFYLSGRHFAYTGYETNSSSQINSIYANFYYRDFIRFDAFYFSNKYEIPGDTNLVDYSQADHDFFDLNLTAGSKNHKISMYVNSDDEVFTNLTATTSTIRNFGFQTESHGFVQGFNLSYGLLGQQSKISTDLYGNYSPNSIALWLQCTKYFKDLFLSASGQTEFTNTEDLFYCPEFRLGIELFDSATITAGLGRGYRAPTIQEEWQNDSMYELAPEYYWREEITFQARNSWVNLYKLDFTDPIFVSIDSLGYESHENLAARQTIGIAGYFELPLYLHKSEALRSTDKISISYSGNYLLKNDSVPLMPKGISCLGVAWDHTTERFGAKFAVEQRYVSTRQDLSAQDLAAFNIFSVTAVVRVVTLSGTVRIDNIFDENYAYLPNAPMAPRSFFAAIKWEFWN